VKTNENIEEVNRI